MPPTTIRAASQALIENMSPDDWTLLSEKLLPATWLQQELTGNIDRFFEWLNGSGTTPDISFNLSTLKARLTSADARSAAQIIIPKLPSCTASQEQQLSANTPIRPAHPTREAEITKRRFEYKALSP